MSAEMGRLRAAQVVSQTWEVTPETERGTIETAMDVVKAVLADCARREPFSIQALRAALAGDEAEMDRALDGTTERQDDELRRALRMMSHALGDS